MQLNWQLVTGSRKTVAHFHFCMTSQNNLFIIFQTILHYTDCIFRKLHLKCVTKINRNSFYSTANVYLSNATLLNKEIISVSCICNASVTGNNRIIRRDIWINKWNRDIENFWRQFAIGDSFLVRVSGICLPKTEFKPQISVGFWHYSQVNVIILLEKIFYNFISTKGDIHPK